MVQYEKKEVKAMKTKEIVLSGVLIALITVATAFVQVPLTLGFINMGDAIILVTCFLLKQKKAIPVSAIGSALGDLVLGYYVYIPATLVIKTILAFCFSLLIYEKPTFVRCLVAVVLGAVIVPVGYFLFETPLYGAVSALASVPFNALQGGACALIGCAVVQAVRKVPIVEGFRKK